MHLRVFVVPSLDVSGRTERHQPAAIALKNIQARVVTDLAPASRKIMGTTKVAFSGYIGHRVQFLWVNCSTGLIRLWFYTGTKAIETDKYGKSNIDTDSVLTSGTAYIVALLGNS